jgi:SAM-dependent methyltransferase
VENGESLSFDSGSFDLVFCKESLHHLARPVLGLYEMLRVCRRAALWIEPYETLAGRVFERLGWSSVYETQQVGNLAARDNYVYRWSRRQIESLLNSYYLESGYTLEMTLGWMSSRWNAHPSAGVRRAAALLGWGLGFVPGSRGNYLTALVWPGRDLPPDPSPMGGLVP